MRKLRLHSSVRDVVRVLRGGRMALSLALDPLESSQSWLEQWQAPGEALKGLH